MTGAESGFLGWVANLALVLLLCSMGLALVRLAIGPSLPDRVIALDLVATLTVAFTGVFAIATGKRVFLDVGIAFAVVGFLTTVAFARYAERRTAKDAGAAGRT